MQKRILYAVSCTVLILAYGVIAHAITLSVSSEEGAPGDTVVVKINIDNTNGIVSLTIEPFEYDANILAVKEVKATALIEGLLKLNDNITPGVIILAAVGLQPFVGLQPLGDGNGAIYEITFEVKADAPPGKTPLTIGKASSLSDILGNDLPVTIENGEFTVLGNAAPSVEKGDVNVDGKVRANDAFLAMQIAVGLIEPTAEQTLAADMNDDSKIRSSDAFAILRKAVGFGAPALVSSHVTKAVKISLNRVEGITGDNVRLLLTVDKPAAIGSADINIAYESAILTATNVETSGNSLWAVNFNGRGQIRLATANLEASRESVLATIYFKVIRNDKTVFDLRGTEAFGFDALPLTVTKVNGEFTSPLIVPERSLLEQNFPNPFNPETWIPYQLKDSSQVVITIYDVSGRIIRTFDLGYQPAGIYSTRSGAVYWDGYNDAGENVTSGIYFYTLKTKTFTQTRRMLLIK